MILLKTQINEARYLTEEVEGQKRLYIEGPYLQSEIENRNKRVYPRSILAPAVNNYIREKVERKCAWGELGHPDTPQINLDRICHRIVSLKEDGNDWIGKALVTETNHGDIVRGLIGSGGVLGVSSRGVGSIKLVEGKNMVQDDYHISTAADVVADPSAPDAYVQPLMEQKEWVWNSGIIVEADIAQMHREVKQAKSGKQLEETKLKVFERFLSLL